MHPNHPMVPIIHMNIRYFEMPSSFGKQDTPACTLVWWWDRPYPALCFDEDAQFFHQHLKNVCDHYNADFYPRFKQWADDYFFIKHRKKPVA
jgi:coproporphyrinogen III oxidase